LYLCDTWSGWNETAYQTVIHTGAYAPAYQTVIHTVIHTGAYAPAYQTVIHAVIHTGACAPAYQTVSYTQQQVPSVTQIQLFLLMMDLERSETHRGYK